MEKEKKIKKARIMNVSNVNRYFVINKTTKFHVLKNIKFSVNEGSFLSIMGPSGSGKSTLLYILGGLDEPDNGSVSIGKRSLQQMNFKEKSLLKKRDIGFIFQFYNLVPNLTVEDNILLPLILDGKNIKDYDKKLDSILKSIGIKELKKSLPRNLSGGQQQRVAIARALIIEPKIILADEPIGNLDSKSGENVMKILEKINKDMGTTIIQVTHSEEAAKYGTDIIRMKDGQIVSKQSLKQGKRKRSSQVNA